MGKGFWWGDPNTTLSVLEPTEAAARKFGLRHGCDVIHLKEEHICVLKEGKMLAWTDGEYSTFVILEGTEVIAGERASD